MKTLIVDNYDSFTFNLCQYIGELGGNPLLFKNDALTVEKAVEINPTHVIISPGPGTVLNKKDFGVCEKIILELGQTTPLLGVCLGHQGIAYAYGGKIIRSPKIVHGRQSLIDHDGKGIFKGVANPFEAMRYHSLCVDEKTLPACLEITARARNENTIMALRHGKFPVSGIQFHPESFGTPEGKKILQNFLSQKHA